VNKKTWNILLIDDDEEDYLITRYLLSEIRGVECQLEWVSSLEAGRQALEARVFDAALVDYDLGVGKGLDLIREVVATGYTSPMILLTGHGSYEVDLEAMQAGASLYLTKEEVNPRVLERTIRYAIEYKRVVQALQEAHDGLELKVVQRTAEIAHINRELRAEVATRRSTEKIIRLQSTALEAAADGIMITDRQGVIQWCNPAMTAMTGYSASELIGRTPSLFKSDRHPSEFYQILWDAITSGQIWRGETYNRRKDGTQYIEEQTITPVLDASGRISNFIAIKHDITVRKEAEEKIIQAYRMAETLRSAGLALSQSLDLDVVIQTMLDSFKRLVPEADRIILFLKEDGRFQVKAVVDNRSAEGFAPIDAYEVGDYSLIQEVVETRTPMLVEDTFADQRWRPILNSVETHSWLGVPIMVGGKVIGLCSLATESGPGLTQEHIRLTEALLGGAAAAIQNARLYQEVLTGREQHQALSRRLVEVQEMERRYIARELHDETSQALIGLVFALDILKREAGDPQAVSTGVDALDQLVGDILNDLHQLAVDLHPAALDHLGLVPAIRQYVDGIRQKCSIEIQLSLPDLPKRLPLYVETNLYRIIQEALANVVRHSHASQVEVCVECEREMIRIAVIDDGAGFDLDEVLANGRLGLFGMRERAEMLGGALTINSNPGRGTSIILEAPCVLTNSDHR
jgi:PAS domain S-box-containing protein